MEFGFQDIMVVQGEEVVVVAQGKETDSWLGLGALGVPGLPSLSLVAKYSCFLCWAPREKSSVEEEIKEKEEAIRQRSSEVQVRSRRLCLSVSTVDTQRRDLLARRIDDLVAEIFSIILLVHIYEHVCISAAFLKQLDHFCCNYILKEKINNTFGWQSHTLVQNTQLMSLREGEAAVLV